MEDRRFWTRGDRRPEQTETRGKMSRAAEGTRFSAGLSVLSSFQRFGAGKPPGAPGGGVSHRAGPDRRRKDESLEGAEDNRIVVLSLRGIDTPWRAWVLWETPMSRRSQGL